jgi:hypothetical protein
MTSQNDIYEKLGHILASQNAMREDIAELKTDISQSIKPAIESYRKDRNILIGAALTISAIFGSIFGGIGKAIAKTFGS